MVNFERNKEYFVKFGEAEPEKAIYLGMKNYTKVSNKHTFLTYGRNRRYTGRLRVYLGDIDKVTFEDGIVHIKCPKTKGLNHLEERLIQSLINKLQNQ